MAGIYFANGDNLPIDKEKEVKVIEYSNTDSIDIKSIKLKRNPLKKCRKLSKHEYVNLETEEVMQYKTNEIKTEEAIKKSMKKVEQLLKNNFTGADNELFITLTTEEETTDFETIKAYYSKFWKKLTKNNKSLQGVCVFEKQQTRNSWHIHLILKDIEHKYLYINNGYIEELWGKGYCKTSRINKNNGIKTAKEINEEKYMNEVHFEEEMQNFDIDMVIAYMTKMKTKEELPAHKNAYSKSKMIQFPQTKKMKYAEAQKLLTDKHQLNGEKTILVKSSKTDAVLNVVKTEKWVKR